MQKERQTQWEREEEQQQQDLRGGGDTQSNLVRKQQQFSSLQTPRFLSVHLHTAK